MEFHRKDLRVIENALSVAAVQYRADAEVERRNGLWRTSAQSLTQASDCAHLLQRIAEEGEDD
jgi:hypothetical protein